MIYDKLCNLERYRGLSCSLDKAIDFLQTTDLTTLPSGRVEVDGEKVFANHFTYTTGPFSEESLFEAHERYLDLHIDISGCEKMAVSSIEEVMQVEVREAEDSVMYRGALGDTLNMGDGRFLLVYPGEAHLPRIVCGASVQVNKLVLKIAL